MKKIIVVLIIIAIPFIAKGFEVKLIHSPEIESEADGVVFIPSENTPYEFTGFLEEEIKKNTKLEVINRKAFSDFLKNHKIGRERITEKDLIKIYKTFGNIDIIFVDLKNLSVEKDFLKGKIPCKKGTIDFEISVFHSRDGLVLKNKNIEFQTTVCSKTPIYPETSKVVEILFFKLLK
ncbi:hypothetical protein TTHT_2125 [Thermotomaculum hydrothermale]|uniref:Uncharacterized protein n=1 Tax=Thermotomaculum hydrothermale TaxID=981385 RepID=A0A7R6PH05_9BACT|nr:hypothetical protein [Thermotomaculum hydrothermale]BBB33559.1 hypothetical protein TTHT_2125 [Thermotomaculum hydrothermale]